jgi:hypothetical protein
MAEAAAAARVSLPSTRMQIEDKLVNLAPGMAVTVEIKTGARRIIEFVLSPLLRYRQEGLRERRCPARINQITSFGPRKSRRSRKSEELFFDSAKLSAGLIHGASLWRGLDAISCPTSRCM